MKDEVIKGIIPHVYIQTALGMDSNTLIISNKRLVFLPISRGYHTLIGAGAVGYLATASAQSRAPVKGKISPSADLDALIRQHQPKYVFDNSTIQEIRLKKGFGGTYNYSIFGLNKNKKVKRLLDGYIAPTISSINKQVKQGMTRKEVLDRYARKTVSLMHPIFGRRITGGF